MNSSPGTDLPTDLLERWRALQRFRARRTPGRCDCRCRQCSAGAGLSARTRRVSAND